VSFDPAIEAEARRLFPEDQIEFVVRYLSTVGIERVQLAVLKLSEGHLDKLGHYGDLALVDYRDVIYWAETQRNDSEPRSYDQLRGRLRLPPDDQHPT
jgi:hypothetical protein